MFPEQWTQLETLVLFMEGNDNSNNNYDNNRKKVLVAIMTIERLNSHSNNDN